MALACWPWVRVCVVGMGLDTKHTVVVVDDVLLVMRSVFERQQRTPKPDGWFQPVFHGHTRRKQELWRTKVEA